MIIWITWASLSTVWERPLNSLSHSAPWPSIWPLGGLRTGQIWGFQTLTEKDFIQFISNLASVLMGECSESFPFSILWPNETRHLLGFVLSECFLFVIVTFTYTPKCVAPCRKSPWNWNMNIGPCIEEDNMCLSYIKHYKSLIKTEFLFVHLSVHQHIALYPSNYWIYCNSTDVIHLLCLINHTGNHSLVHFLRKSLKYWCSYCT